MADYAKLLKRVQEATGPDWEMDADIAQAAECVEIQWRQANGTMEMYPVQRYPSTAHASGFGISPVPDYTASVDATIALMNRVLPGWAWRGGTCCVSDDCFIFPDFNSPIHGERLKREFPQLVQGVEWSDFTDIDRRPAGNVPLAILESVLTALVAIEAAKATPV